ncbi:hypothetical protein V7S43_015922 [Phytophthora oleae]|uniref:Crinkler effector protein N-terminal domain-containing protein n=1 Tax=Phytophthora oleae TaxID=2107226 RepID=A0ABD3EWX5_9STRA
MVGLASDTFSVDINEDKLVDELNGAKKTEKSDTIKCEEDLLRLFLAKNNGTWLTEAAVKEGVSDVIDLKPLEAVRAKLRLVGLLEKDVSQGDEKDEAEGKGPVNVVVVIPTAEPIGPCLDYFSSGHLFAFLESEMTDKEKIVSSPHILAPASLQFPLVGREQAITTAAK